MTNKLPEALRIAAAISGWYAPAHASIADCDKAAAMLRTQHALLEQARDALNQMYQRAASEETQAMTDAELSGISTSAGIPADVQAEAQEVVFIRSTLAALNQHLDKS